MADAIATTSPNVSQPRSNTTIAVDNLLRKVLRVSDPRDPDQIANALLSRYPDEADKDLREREGYAYSSDNDYTPPAAPNTGASSAELAQAQDDLDRDIQTLSTASQLKDIRVEMEGWGRAIRRIGTNGIAAARLALDSANVDRAMAARRSLAEYARLARYVGTLTEGSSLIFRSFAQSCDVYGALTLVAIGEGYAASGITRSTSMIRVAASELQARRNAVIMALRALTGSIESSLAPDAWPRGLEAYRQLVSDLENGGQADLRELLDEGVLSQAMDDLVDLATGANVNGLRVLSTTSTLLVHRFQRLIQFGSSVRVGILEDITDRRPESPPLVTFMSALQLFVDAFTSQGGSRLLYLARPPIVVYGLYGATSGDQGAIVLNTIAGNRGTVLERADCACSCSCESNAVRRQVLIDFLQHLVDRSIDLYALGTATNGMGTPEQRAAAYGRVIQFVLDLQVTDANKTALVGTDTALTDALTAIGKALAGPFAGQTGADTPASIKQELLALFTAETQNQRLVRALAPNCHPSLFAMPWEIEDLASTSGALPLSDRLKALRGPGESLILSILRVMLADAKVFNPEIPEPIRFPPTADASLSGLQGRGELAQS